MTFRKGDRRVECGLGDSREVGENNLTVARLTKVDMLG